MDGEPLITVMMFWKNNLNKHNTFENMKKGIKNLSCVFIKTLKRGNSTSKELNLKLNGSCNKEVLKETTKWKLLTIRTGKLTYF